MENFRINNLERNSELFNLANELEVLADEMRHVFNGKSKENDFRRSKMPLHKTVFLYLITTVMQRFNSIRILCTEGYGQCSLIILRSMLESLISAKYIILDEKVANERAERFEEYRWVEMRKHLKYWKTEDVHNKELAKTILSRETEVIDNFNKFKERFIKNNKELSTWSGNSIEDMARDVGMLADYNSVYRLCCNSSHPSFLGTGQSVVKTKEATHYSSSPSLQNVIANVEMSIVYFAEFLFIYDYLFGLGMRQRIYDYQTKAKQVFALRKYALSLTP
ncbi:MAG TPA: DUF5677 domain-containing protein, partial [Cytophagaceae bacterium]|jgi:hypothetical protein|nr:DUF5677 domain-containing protein [Cytophagaceae bacterium]